MVSLKLLNNCVGKKVELSTNEGDELTGILKTITSNLIHLSQVVYKNGLKLSFVSYELSEINLDSSNILDSIENISNVNCINPVERQQNQPKKKGNGDFLNRPISVEKETPIHLRQMKEQSRPNQLLYLKVKQEMSNPREAPSLDLEKSSLKFLQLLSRSSAENSYLNNPTHFIILSEKNSTETKLVFEYLAQQHVIGVCCFGCETSDKLYLMGISTNRLVVLIEPHVLQAKNRSGDITLDKYPLALFTSPSIMRVAYDARWLGYVMHSLYNIEMGDMVDLQVLSHGLCPTNNPKHNTVLPLSRIIAQHLYEAKYPYVVRINERKEDDGLWANRPLCNTMLNQSFFYLAYLVPLYQKMLTFLLSPVISATRERMRFFKEPGMKSKRFTNPLDASDLPLYSKFWHFRNVRTKRDMEKDALLDQLRGSIIPEEELSECDRESSAGFSSATDSDDTRSPSSKRLSHPSNVRDLPDGGSSGEENSASRRSEAHLLKPHQMTVGKVIDDKAHFVSGVLKANQPSYTDEDFCAIPTKRRSDPIANYQSTTTLSTRKGSGRGIGFVNNNDDNMKKETPPGFGDSGIDFPLSEMCNNNSFNEADSEESSFQKKRYSLPASIPIHQSSKSPARFLGFGRGITNSSSKITATKDVTVDRGSANASSSSITSPLKLFGRGRGVLSTDSLIPGSNMGLSSLSLRSRRVDEELSKGD